MEVTLKKAADFARAAGEAADAIKLDVSKRVSIHEARPGDAIRAQQAAFHDGLTAYDDLIDAQYAIRSLIGDANARWGINAILSDRAAVEVKIKKLAKLIEMAENEGETSVETLVSEVGAALSRSERAERGFFDGNISYRTVTADLLSSMKVRLSALKRQKSDLTDKAAGVNLNTRIAMPETVVATLKAHSLI